ncbi:hypothetical protein MCUN1_001633 [Malassezia cuniculi]|uniref:Uncharacterized protein n=1 Tax=Malassezia cuniculi TaxID=948313 RepID=A0AAF0EUG9_9BASI|nr:hypothetical protein MCUN1_001633 [Malassezia cuniculi]
MLRKCEYERVSEHDNLLSRERKRLSRERKAARLAASAAISDHGREERPETLSMPQLHMPNLQISPTFTMNNPGMVPVSQPPHFATTSPLMQPAPDTVTPASWHGAAHGGKDVMPWLTTNGFSDMSLSSVTLSAASESLRSTADPALLDLTTAKNSTRDDGASILAMPWSQSLSPPESSISPVPMQDTMAPTLAPVALSGFGPNSAPADLMDATMLMDTPLKLFSDEQSLSNGATAAVSSADTNTQSDTKSNTVGQSVSMNLSPLSPQLAPLYDPIASESNARGSVSSGFDSSASSSDLCSPSLGFGSAPLPLHESLSGIAPDLEPSSVPMLSSWTQLAPSNI